MSRISFTDGNENDNYEAKRITPDKALDLLNQGYSLAYGDSSLNKKGENKYSWVGPNDRGITWLEEKDVRLLIPGHNWRWAIV